MDLYFVITEKCNYHCPFCIRGEKFNDFMDFNSFKKVVDSNNFSNDTAIITGGEPTLHPFINDFLNYSSNKFKTVVICSNGSNYVDFNAKNFIVQLSLDGTKNTHNRIRSSNAFEEFMKSYNFYKSRGLKLIISTTVSKYNSNDIENMIPLIEDLNPYLWKVNLDQNDWEEEGGIGIDKWNKLVDKLLKNTNVKLSIKKQFPINEINNVNIKSINTKHLNCGCCKSKCYIYPDFTVYPCTCLKDFPLGNMLEYSLNMILNNRKSTLFKKYLPSKSKKCLECKYLPICNGGCVGSSYKKYGELGHEDPRCPLENK